ncbi:hypothetical protein ACVWXB_000118 [Streptomyces sp. TE12347]
MLSITAAAADTTASTERAAAPAPIVSKQTMGRS